MKMKIEKLSGPNLAGATLKSDKTKKIEDFLYKNNFRNQIFYCQASIFCYVIRKIRKTLSKGVPA